MIKFSEQEAKIEKYLYTRSPNLPCSNIQMHKDVINQQKKFFHDFKGLQFFSQNSRFFKRGKKSYLNMQKPEKKNRIYESFIPNEGHYLMEMDAPIYNCKFNDLGNLLMIATQVFDTSDLLEHNEKYGKDKSENFKEFEDVTNQDNQKFVKKQKANLVNNNIAWAITDCDISEDNKFLVHSSLNPIISYFDMKTLAYTYHINVDDNPQDYNPYFYDSRIYSLKISGDNNNLLIGTGKSSNSAQLKVYDLDKEKVSYNIMAHKRDINTICYANRTSSSLFLSGSDDGLCKVWDTRALGLNYKPIGYFSGHFSGELNYYNIYLGLTSVTSREDDIYFASNGKDQFLKVWDIRKMETSSDKNIFVNFDYRYEYLSPKILHELRSPEIQKKHNDCSVLTFSDHVVLRTLIRCHFSPKELTNSRFLIIFLDSYRYVYTGSACGNVFIYDLFTGEKTAQMVANYNGGPVRDCLWHPTKPIIISGNLQGELYQWDFMADKNFSEKIEEKKKRYQEGRKKYY